LELTRKNLFIFGVFLFLFSLHSTLFALNQKKIFILHSYSAEYRWTKGQNEGFVKTIKEHCVKPVEISVEYLDTKRVSPIPEYQKNFLNYLKMKYANYTPDVIYVSDDDALNFIIANKDNLFSNTPVVFSGINNLPLEKTIDKKRFVGVYELKEIEPNIELIRVFSPMVKDVWFVGDDSSTYKAIRDDIEQQSKKFADIKLHFVASKEINDVLAGLKTAPNRSFVLLTTIGGFLDSNGAHLTLAESIAKLTQLQNIVFMSTEDAYVQGGVVGGYVTNGQKQGSIAASMAIKILNSTPTEQIQSVLKNSNSYMFDRQALNKSKLILSEYTARNAVIINEDQSFFMRNQVLIQNLFYLFFIATILFFIVLYFVLKRKNRALQKETIRYVTLMELATDGIHVINTDGDLVEFSDSFALMLGYSHSEMYRLNVADWDDSIQREQLQDDIESLMENPRTFETKHRKKDGTLMDVEINARGIKLDDKTYLYASARDITEKKQLTQNLQALVNEETAKRVEKEKLLIQQSKMAMMGEMISMIAHQWRQPLNALGIGVKDVELAFALGEIDNAYVRRFKEESMHIIQTMSKTIDDFRDFFKPTKSKEHFIVEIAVQQALYIMGPLIHSKQIKLYFNTNSESAVFGYKNEFQQVIIILLSNAKDALECSNVEEPHIEIDVDDNGCDKIAVTISDNAGGIPREILDRIFEPYFTTKEQGKGTGIGLYMAKEIIERQMGGKLAVQNSSEGAKFSILLDKA
jgi:PAS domain S-box-containing protein